jgi:hypothetical protein
MHRIVWLLMAVVVTTGCARAMSDRELQRVARDWSMVVRASQIIPVYPLTEDLQPGDVFLVQVTVDEQAKIYRERGFLTLDNLIFRLNPRGYESFYRQSFEAGGAQHPLPREWLTPGKAEAWVLAPNASFPTYAFSARRGGGFNVALPVQGIPVGLSLLGGDATQGTITLAEARTYGVDTMSLHDDVRRWAEANRSFLQFYGSDTERTNYLRVVSRVYLTGRINVALQSAQSSGATLSGGASKPVDLVAPSATGDPQKNTLDAYTSNIEKLNAMIEKALERAGGSNLAPGGTVKVVAASSGSITLAEDFARPLVIGYLGFDMAIGPGGVLGPPMPTHAVLERRVSPALRGDVGVRLASTAALAADYQTLKTLAAKGDVGARGFVTDLDALGALVPAAYPCNILGQRNPGGPLEVIWTKGRALDVGTGLRPRDDVSRTPLHLHRRHPPRAGRPAGGGRRLRRARTRGRGLPARRARGQRGRTQCARRRPPGSQLAPEQGTRVPGECGGVGHGQAQEERGSGRRRAGRAAPRDLAVRARRREHERR